MKNKTFFKILFGILSICYLLFALHYFFYCLNMYLKVLNDKGLSDNQYQIVLNDFIQSISYYSVTLIFSILFFLVVNFKDLQFVTVSTIQLIKEHREKTSEERKAKKQAKLSQEIAQKQAELDELNNELKTE